MRFYAAGAHAKLAPPVGRPNIRRRIQISAEMQTGVNAYSLYANFNNVQNVAIKAVDGKHKFACLQLRALVCKREWVCHLHCHIARYY